MRLVAISRRRQVGGRRWLSTSTGPVCRRTPRCRDCTLLALAALAWPCSSRAGRQLGRRFAT